MVRYRCVFIFTAAQFYLDGQSSFNGDSLYISHECDGIFYPDDGKNGEMEIFLVLRGYLYVGLYAQSQFRSISDICADLSVVKPI